VAEWQLKDVSSNSVHARNGNGTAQRNGETATAMAERQNGTLETRH